MNIHIDIGHPAHVHFFRNLISEMKSSGHNVVVTARKKEVSVELLNQYGIEFIDRGELKGSLVRKAIDMPMIDMKLRRIFKEKEIDLSLGILNPYVAQTSWFLKKPSIIFNDTENAKLALKLTKPFCSAIMTPDCYKDEIGKKQIRYPGYHELAYLHPNRFQPDPSILESLGVEKEEIFSIIRFVSWQASHDVGHPGISSKNKTLAVKEFSKYGRVFISSEGKLPKELRKFQIKIPPTRIHHAMKYATLLYGESSTMASECALLGTPAIYLDNEGRGYTDEQEKEFGAVFNFTESEKDQTASIKKGIEILKDAKVKKKWSKKRVRILKDKIDVTEFLSWLINNFPRSLEKMRKEPDYANKFKSK